MKTELDISKRWMEGRKHHSKTDAIVGLINDIDWKLGGDVLGLNFGGDGDNGEHLAYILDIIYDAEDNGELKQLSDRLKRSDPLLP